MAGPKTLDPDRMTTDELLREALFLALRIRQCPEAHAIEPRAQALLASARAGQQAEAALAERIVEAEAGVALRDGDLDLAVAEHRAVILRKTRGRTDAGLYQRFYRAMPPSDVVRLGLRSELAIVGPWVGSLLADGDPDLQALGRLLQQAVTAGEAAVAAHQGALQAMRDFRAGERPRLFAAQNLGRRTIWVELTRLSRGAEGARTFFRPSPKRAVRTEPTVAEAEAAVGAAEAQLQGAQGALVEARARASAAAAAAEKRAAAQRDLAQAEAEAEALARRIAALRTHASA